MKIDLETNPIYNIQKCRNSKKINFSIKVHNIVDRDFLDNYHTCFIKVEHRKIIFGRWSNLRPEMMMKHRGNLKIMTISILQGIIYSDAAADRCDFCTLNITCAFSMLLVVSFHTVFDYFFMF